MKNEIREKHGFPSIVGIIDGALINLAFKPIMHGKDYFIQQFQYIISTMIICYHTRQILFI